MKFAILTAVIIFLLPVAVQAQDITASPICFTVRNAAPYSVYGSIVTDYYTAPDGTRARHTSNFRFNKAGSKDSTSGAPADRAQFCSTGPFYPGRQLELIIRTLVPIFDCKTSVELGEIVINGEYKSDGTTRTWATCY